jgi:hypothetical protein
MLKTDKFIAGLQNACATVAQVQNMLATWLCNHCTGTKHARNVVVLPLHRYKTCLQRGCATVAQVQDKLQWGCAAAAQVVCRLAMRLCRFFIPVSAPLNPLMPLYYNYLKISS